MTSITKEQNNKAYASLKDSLGITNAMQAPKFEKVVISVGTGSIKDKKRVELIADRLAKITGQKASPRAAKQSIATFKLREGDIVGYQVTLRGARMYNFLDKLFHTALPRTKDFRGISEDSIDEMGNYTLGIKEHTIFPETSDEDVKDVFGMAITLVVSSRSKADALAFYKYIGLPFKKSEDK